MKRYVALMAAAWLGGLAGLRGESLDEEYLRIYDAIQEADALSGAAQADPALVKYGQAQAALLRFQQAHPDWNVMVVKYRLSDLTNKIAELSPKASGSRLGPGLAALTLGAASNSMAATAPKPPPPEDWQEQLTAIKLRASRFEADNRLLEAKLREAIALRPAAIDPAELAKALERVKTLEKENELLKVSLAEIRTKQASILAGQAADRIQHLERERDDLRKQIEAQKRLPGAH